MIISQVLKSGRREMDKTFEFKPENVKKVKIDKITPNTWNPKPADPPEMEYIKKSLQQNGYATPILVRRKDGGYEIIDGQHRFLAAKELGYKELYIYDAGEVSDEDAKAMTIWMQTQVKFDESELAPLVMELNDLSIELPYNDLEIEGFRNLATFDFEEAWKDQTPIDEPKKDEEILTIKMTLEQFEIVNNSIEKVKSEYGVKEGEALKLICEQSVSLDEEN